MVLNQDTHKELFFRTHYATLMEAAHTHCLSRGIPHGPVYEAAISAWMSHAVIRFATMIDDPRWRLAYCFASASNRAHRENERVRRASVKGARRRAPYGVNEAYFRRTHMAFPNLHIVAFQPPHEVIDLTLWRWRDPDKDVFSAESSWISLNGFDTPQLPDIRGAFWDYYRIALPNSEEEIGEKIPTAKGIARRSIDAALRRCFGDMLKKSA